MFSSTKDTSEFWARSRTNTNKCARRISAHASRNTWINAYQRTYLSRIFFENDKLAYILKLDFSFSKSE